MIGRSSQSPSTRFAGNVRRLLLMVPALVLLLLTAYFSRQPDQPKPAAEPAGSTATSQPTGTPSAMPPATRTPGATVAPDDGVPTIAFSALPRQAQDTIHLIDRGGPFPYRQDGVVFQNRERLLRNRPSGYYREYTVKTPGESDRGPRRIVAGGGGELYYTADHYASFKRVLR